MANYPPFQPLLRRAFFGKHGLRLGVLIITVLASLAPSLIGTRADEQAGVVARARLLQGLDVPKREFVPDELLVRFRSGTSELQKSTAHAFVNARLAKRFDSVSQLEKVILSAGTSVPEAIAQYRARPEVLYAEPNYIVRALQNLTIPNDPQFSRQWNLHNTGQGGGAPGADIRAPEAWSLTTGSANVVVALIDSGADYMHPDLSSQIWSAPLPFTVTRTQGDVFTCPAGSHGFNAVDGNCDPQDDLGHGTHVAGIMGAATNNAVGVAGINWNIQILPCKFLNSLGIGDVGAALTCLDMVKSLKDSGINIVASNNSWGGGPFSQSLYDAIAAQEQSGILFVAAAGNDFLDNDFVPGYPADYALPNILSVAASNRQDEFAAFSNLGRRTTHLSAPGDQILSTTPKNTYSVFSGTSAAAPHVTGVAALLKAQDPSRDWRTIKNLLLSGGDTVAALGSTITGKRVNASQSLNCSNQVVQSRLLPEMDTISATVGSSVSLTALSINCAQPLGPINVSVSPGGQNVALLDDSTNPDQAAGDGIFSGTWTPASTGSYTLSFPWGDTVQVEVLVAYRGAPQESGGSCGPAF
jgi:subtilisin family serine protease